MSPLLETDSGREPLVVIEIDQDLCEEVYSVAPCTAALGVTGDFKCYNTRQTCQDPDNYNVSTPTPLTLRFGKPNTALPLGLNILPYLVSVSTTPTRVNVGGRPGRDGSFGKRSSVTIVMKDAPHSDNLVDPYIPDRPFSDQLERSTFWAKWLARNPFYVGRDIRVLEGYVGQDLASMQTRHYIIDKVEGPDAQNNVSIRASDILRIADDKKAVTPEPTDGELEQDIDDVTAVIPVNADSGTYDLGGGILRIDNEVIRYTSGVFGGGLFSLLGGVRGSDGTEAATHKEGATVQRCVEFTGLKGWEVASAILKIAGVPASFITDADWAAEADKWAGGFEVYRLLTEPTGIAKMVGELCQQCLFYLWWDERNQQVKLKAVRPPLPSELITLTEDLDIIQGSFRPKVRPEERITEVWIHHQLTSAVGKSDDSESYQRTRLRVDPEASTPEKYGDRVKYEITAVWLTGDAQVSPLSFRILSRYKDNPRYATFQLDAKDRTLQPGDTVDIVSRTLVDFEGLPKTTRFEIIQIEEAQPGHLVQVEVQDSQFTNRYAYFTQNAAPVYQLASESELELGAWWAYPKTAGPATNFPSDNLPPFVFI